MSRWQCRNLSRPACSRPRTSDSHCRLNRRIPSLPAARKKEEPRLRFLFLISTLFSRAVSIVGVQQFVRQMAVRFMQELAVQRLDVRVLVGLTKRQLFVHLIQTMHAVFA